MSNKKYEIIVTENGKEIFKVTYNLSKLIDAVKLFVYDIEQEGLV
jgi:hypothetical protein